MDFPEISVHLVNLVYQETIHQCHWTRMENAFHARTVQPANLVQVEHLELQDQKAHVERTVAMVQMVKTDPLAMQEMLDQVVKTEDLAPRVTKVPMDLKANQAELGRRDHQAHLAQQGMQDPQEEMVNQVAQAVQAKKAQEEKMANQVQKVPLVNQANQVVQERTLNIALAQRETLSSRNRKNWLKSIEFFLHTNNTNFNLLATSFFILVSRPQQVASFIMLD